MSKNILPITISILVIFTALKLFSYLLWKASGDSGTLVVSLEALAFGIGILLAVGFVIGFIWLRLGSKASDEELKIVGGGVFGLTFLSGLCLGGFCIPAAALSSIFSLLYLIPMLIGLKIANLFYSKDA